MKSLRQQFNLITEMYETVEIIRNFTTKSLQKPVESLKSTRKILLTGEGSSRIFPAKNIIYQTLKEFSDLTIITEGSRQANELNLNDITIFGASNSGKTVEVIDFFRSVESQSKFSLTTFSDTPLGKLSAEEFNLNCGAENAVAATKSVIEQALFYQNFIYEFFGRKISAELLNELANKAEAVLNMQIADDIINRFAEAQIIYFAGRNNGVAEEAALKTNEITRKKSDYLEGTYAVHGIEEVMNSNECLVLIEPYEEEESKILEVLAKGVGLFVVAISSRQTLFPTIKIPAMENFNGYLQLMSCWNLLVSTGLMLGINLDKPVRARKIGNECVVEIA